MLKILLGALSCQAFEDRRRRCLGTWVPEVRSFDIDVVFLVGGCSGEPRREGDLLLLPCPDDYPSLPQKVGLFYQWALAHSDFDYIFKCDDDTYLHAGRLAEFDPGGRDYIGAEWSPGVGYGSGGAGYWLSRRAAAIVAEGLAKHACGDEDVLVGRCLSEAGIPFHIDPRFIAFGDDDRRPTPDNTIITTHGCDRPWKAHRAEFLGERPIVTCSPAGRLGNNLFQVAAVLGFAAKHGTHTPIFAENLFHDYRKTIFRNLRYGPIPQECMSISDPPDFSFDHQIPAWPTCSVRFQGYMQSEKYFSHCRELIRETFRMPDDVEFSLKKRFNTELEGEPVAIHVRRGDYLQKPQFHPVQPAEYYLEGLKMITERIPVKRVLCFSDDPDWCERHLAPFDHRISVIRLDDEYSAFALMSLCRHHVISNSTFSWWAAWLAAHSNQIVIVPPRFFGPAFSGYNEQDLIPDAWIRLKRSEPWPPSNPFLAALVAFLQREGATVTRLRTADDNLQFSLPEIDETWHENDLVSGDVLSGISASTSVSAHPVQVFDWILVTEISLPQSPEGMINLVGNLHRCSRKGVVVHWKNEVPSSLLDKLSNQFHKLGYSRDILTERDLVRQIGTNDSQNPTTWILRRECRRVDTSISVEEIRLLVERDDPVILELGCHDGEDSRRFLAEFPQIRLHCFEPDPRPIARFQIDDPRCTLHQIAIAAEDGPVKFYLSGGRPPDDRMPDWDLSSSIHKPTGHLIAHPWCTFTRTCRVQGMRLDSWHKQHSEITMIDFLWADLQGAEGDLIHGGRETLRNHTKYLYTEFYDTPMYEGQLTRKQILSALPEFEPLGIYEGYNILLQNRKLCEQ